MAEDMGITIPSNLAGLITGHAVHSETESDESFNEDDPLNVKEPRSLDAISFESANRRSPIDHESKYTVYDSDKVYDAIHTLQAKVDSIDEKIHYIKSLIVTYSRLCLASVGIISIASTSCLFYFFSSIFVKRISES